jgi:hypothetical protein
MTEPRRPTAIDPTGCGCAECLTGEYVPLDRATWAEVVSMCFGEITNHTGENKADILARAVKPEKLAAALIAWTCAADVDRVTRRLR